MSISGNQLNRELTLFKIRQYAGYFVAILRVKIASHFSWCNEQRELSVSALLSAFTQIIPSRNDITDKLLNWRYTTLTSLSPPLFIEVVVPIQEISGHVFVCIQNYPKRHHAPRKWM